MREKRPGRIERWTALPDSRKFRCLSSGPCFLPLRRNGLFFNPSIAVGDQCKRKVNVYDEITGDTKQRLVSATVTHVDVLRTIDIVHNSTGYEECGLDPRREVEGLGRGNCDRAWMCFSRTLCAPLFERQQRMHAPQGEKVDGRVERWGFLPGARMFGLKTGWCFIFSGRNGILFNPTIIVGDKCKRPIPWTDEEGNTKYNYAEAAVIHVDRNGTIDIAHSISGKVEHGLDPRVDVKGLERGRCDLLWVMVIDMILWALWELYRHLCVISRSNFLKQRYGTKSLYSQEVGAAFEVLSIEDEEQQDWLDLWAEIDTNEDNSMDYQEFLKFMDVPDSLLAERLFQLFDTSASSSISFTEFLHSAWEYCPYDEQRSKLLWYKLLTKGGSVVDQYSVLDLKDITHVLELFYGSKDLKERALLVDEMADADCSGGIEYDEWERFSSGHYLLMYPGYLMQNKLRQRIFGKSYWKEKTAALSHMYQRNKALEKALRNFEQMPLLPNGRRDFDADFSVGGRKPRAKKYAKVVPFVGEPQRLDSVGDHIQNVGFW